MMLATMRRRPLLPLAAAAAALLGAAPAVQGSTKPPTIHLKPACYQSSQQGTLTGARFAANAVWTARLGTGASARNLGSGRTDGHGSLRARFTAPVYHGTAGTRSLTLSVNDGKRTARTTLEMTPLSATFTPKTGNPKTMRVRWRVLGLTPHHGVYVHYIRPDGTLRRTLRIGTTRRPCGTLKTGPIALFPFRYSYGLWTFQVDASPHFSRATLPRLLIDFAIKKGRPQHSGTTPPPPAQPGG
jgi:hypothetical protein